MNITLEEQIEYMRGEVKEWQEVYDKEPELSVCLAILATLEACRDEKTSCVQSGILYTRRDV